MSHMLAQLTGQVKVGKKKLKWTKFYQKALDDIKKVMAKETILNYPNLNEVFEIYIDANVSPLSTVISQGRKYLSFYSRKLSNTKKNYTITELEDSTLWKSLRSLESLTRKAIKVSSMP